MMVAVPTETVGKMVLLPANGCYLLQYTFRFKNQEQIGSYLLCNKTEIFDFIPLSLCCIHLLGYHIYMYNQYHNIMITHRDVDMISACIIYHNLHIHNLV